MAFEGTSRGIASILATKQSGESGISQFLKLEGSFKQAKMLAKAKAIEEARVGMQLQAQKQAGSIELQELKGRQGKELLQSISGAEGEFPPGTTISQGGVTVPVTRKFTGGEQAAIGGAEAITRSIDNINALLDQNPKFGSNLFDQIRVDIGNPLFTSGVLDEIQSELNSLKATVPFAKGGKQLTPFESKLLFRLVETRGKNLKRIKKDINRFKIEYNRLSELATRGSAALQSREIQSEESFNINNALKGL